MKKKLIFKLDEQDVYKDKTNFFSKWTLLVIKIKWQDLLPDSRNISDFIAYLQE